MNTTILNSRIRSKELVAEFNDKYVVNWAFKVSDGFKDALDIKIGERKINGKATLVWTQGHIYSFQKGDTILDHECQSNELWSKSLEYIKCCLQVETSSPCTLKVFGKEEILDPNTEDDEEVEKKKKPKEKKKYILDHGYVKFNILVPNQDKTALEFKCTKECTQVEFVEILKHGLLSIKNEKAQLELSFS